MRILVTGAAGFIGSHLAERLAALGHTVAAIDCLTDYYAPQLKQQNAQALRDRGIDLLPLDLAVDDLQAVLRDTEVIYHAAAQPGISITASFDSYQRNNITATQRLLEAVDESATLRGLIYISTSSVYGADATGSEAAEPRPTSYYGVTKLAAEQLVLARQRDQGLPACSFRLFSVYGPRERPDKFYPQLIRAMLADESVPLYDGSEHHVRSYTYIQDIVDGLVAPLNMLDRCSGEIFNLGIDSTITTGEGIRIVEDLLGKQARIRRLPRRPGDQSRTQANIAKARRVLGYSPAISPQRGLAQTVAWYAANQHERDALH